MLHATTFVRVLPAALELLASYAPRPKVLKNDNPLVVQLETCAACGRLFYAGQLVTLIALGPGNDETERALARAGRTFNAVALPIHWPCVTGKNEEE